MMTADLLAVLENAVLHRHSVMITARGCTPILLSDPETWLTSAHIDGKFVRADAANKEGFFASHLIDPFHIVAIECRPQSSNRPSDDNGQFL